MENTIKLILGLLCLITSGMAIGAWLVVRYVLNLLVQNEEKRL